MMKAAAVCAFTVMTMSFMVQSEKPMTKQADGTYVVNTTSLSQGVKGYQSNTPLKIYIKNLNFIVEWFVKNGIEVWSAMEGQQRFDIFRFPYSKAKKRKR